jgi:hypothetical protein
MRKSFRRRLAMPRFEDPVELRRENSFRAGLAPGRAAQLSGRRLVAWPTTPHATLPVRASVEQLPGELFDERTVAMLADVIASSLRVRDYERIIAAATLLATERRMRRSFGPPYEDYEDDPILR